jgi:hypothetical protein
MPALAGPGSGQSRPTLAKLSASPQAKVALEITQDSVFQSTRRECEIEPVSPCKSKGVSPHAQTNLKRLLDESSVVVCG